MISDSLGRELVINGVFEPDIGLTTSVVAGDVVLANADWGSEPIGALTFIAMVVAIAIVYVRRLPDFAVLAITTGFVALFLMAVGWRVLAETRGFEWDSTIKMLLDFALLTLWCAAMTAGTVKLLTALRGRMESGGADA